MQKTMEQSFREMMDELLGEGWETAIPVNTLALVKAAFIAGALKSVERIIDAGATQESIESVSLELLLYVQGDPRRN